VYVNDIINKQRLSLSSGGAIRFQSVGEEDEGNSQRPSIKSASPAVFLTGVQSCSDPADISPLKAQLKENLPTINAFSAAAESYWADERLSARLGQELIVALYLDTGANTKRYEGYALISSDSIELSVDDIVNESLEFQGCGKLYYRED
jgi:hypothetical protein